MAQIFVSVGSNINKAYHIRIAIDALHTHFGALTLSSVYESEAVGFEGETFYNLVAGFQSALSAPVINQILSQIEEANGRDRNTARFSSRTLDIDLLLYDDIITHSQGLTLPRAETTTHAFVLLPLIEIDEQLRDPVTGKYYRDFWSTLDKTKQKLWKIPFETNPKPRSLNA